MPAQAVQPFPIENSDNTWRDEVFEHLNEQLNQMIEQIDMEKIDGITGAIFKNKSEILGHLA